MAALIIDEQIVNSYRALDWIKTETAADAPVFSVQKQRLSFGNHDELVEGVLSRVREVVSDGYCSNGIRITRDQTGWRIDAFPGQWSALLYFTGWLFGTVFCLVILLKGGGAFAYAVLTLFIILVQLLFVQAVFSMWGHYSVLINDKGVVFVGIASFGVKREFDWAELKRVKLTQAKNARGYIQKQIVLQADRSIRFGKLLNDSQRLFVASAVIVLCSWME